MVVQSIRGEDGSLTAKPERESHFRMKFVASCSCRTFIGYGLSEAAARKAGEGHVAELARSLAAIQLEGAHVLTVGPDRFWSE